LALQLILGGAVGAGAGAVAGVARKAKEVVYQSFEFATGKLDYVQLMKWGFWIIIVCGLLMMVIDFWNYSLGALWMPAGAGIPEYIIDARAIECTHDGSACRNIRTTLDQQGQYFIFACLLPGGYEVNKLNCDYAVNYMSRWGSLFSELRTYIWKYWLLSFFYLGIVLILVPPMVYWGIKMMSFLINLDYYAKKLESWILRSPRDKYRPLETPLG